MKPDPYTIFVFWYRDETIVLSIHHHLTGRQLYRTRFSPEDARLLGNLLIEQCNELEGYIAENPDEHARLLASEIRDAVAKAEMELAEAKRATEAAQFAEKVAFEKVYKARKTWENGTNET